jgi:hypothetical protein
MIRIHIRKETLILAENRPTILPMPTASVTLGRHGARNVQGTSTSLSLSALGGPVLSLSLDLFESHPKSKTTQLFGCPQVRFLNR